MKIHYIGQCTEADSQAVIRAFNIYQPVEVHIRRVSATIIDILVSGEFEDFTVDELVSWFEGFKIGLHWSE